MSQSSAKSIHKKFEKALLYGKKFAHSTWAFPVVLLIPLILLTVLGISGSSIGQYNTLLNGAGTHDANLIANEPRSIRSDEWLVNTQQVIIQSEQNFPRFNHMIGNGQDMSITEAPVKDWTTVFRPQNIAYFILPLEQAFAFRWWLIGYLLIVSCYLFALAVLPGRRLFAILISVALFFSAFVQWWYLYGTLAPLYYSLFIATIVMYISRQKSLRNKFFFTGLLGYLFACFALVLYPPFQIACALVLVAFLLGYAIHRYFKDGWRKLLQNILFVVGGAILGVAVLIAFIFSRIDVVNTINNTAYPGQRSLSSGKFYPEHFMASHLGHQFLSEGATAQYLIDNKSGHTNQSEASNFLLLVPFLLLPAILILFKERVNTATMNWSLLTLSVLFIVFLLQLFAPQFTALSKLFLLNKVGDARLLIGVGLLNIMFLIAFVKSFSKKEIKLPLSMVLAYCVFVLIIELLISMSAHTDFGSFISLKRALLFSIPLPIIIYLILTKRFIASALGYLAFSVFISAPINPLYRGLDIITGNPLSVAIKEIGSTSDERWVSDPGYIENLVALNGESSLSGVYNYPQKELWKTIPEADATSYNRYAHVGFQVDNNESLNPKLELVSADSFVVTQGGCGSYFTDHRVSFILTTRIINSSCLTKVKAIHFSQNTFYIYKLN